MLTFVGTKVSPTRIAEMYLGDIVNNNKATVEFVLEGPTLGYLSDTHIAYDVVLENSYNEMDEYYAWAFMDAFNLVVGDGISKDKARGTLTIEYVKDNIEVTYAESTYED